MDVTEWLGKDNQIGQDIWEKKYRWNGESFDEWLDRVSGGNEELRQIIAEKKFLFAGRILANRGTAKDGRKITYSNCYVVSPPEDNIESIFDTAKKLARTYSYGGGCGVDIGRLSPRGATINNAAKTTSGSVSFMDLYALVTGLIGQSGRRGALMISIPCNHPDLEEFIEVKSDLNKITKANISVRITDEFMNAVMNHDKYMLSFKRDETGEVIAKEIDAYDFFHKLSEMNWNMAEPGLLFWDRINDWNLLSNDDSFAYLGVNPCSEEPLPGGGSCLLSSINLSEFVTPYGTFDMDEFKRVVRIAVRAMNEVLDEGLPLHPLKEQRDSVADWRQIGIGVMGTADCLIKLKMRYGSEEAITFCDSVGRNLAIQTLRESAMMAKEYSPYPAYHKEAVLTSKWLHANCTEDTRKMIEEYGLRNSQLLTSAPTGTLSTMLGISGGIEPIFANYYTRKTESVFGHDKYYKVYTPIVKQYMEAHGIDDDSKLPDFFVTAHDINYKDRIDMQAAWQRHIDASISSTVNLPNEATVEDVMDLYLYAWKKGLKGITIFRDGCARTGILTTDTKAPEQTSFDSKDVIPRGVIIKADDNCVGKKRTLVTGCGTLHCEAFFDPVDGSLLETYFSRGSKGGCNNSYTGLSRMISLAARAGVDIYSICDQLNSCGACPSYAVRAATKHDTSRGSCCPAAISNALLDMYKEMQKEIDADEIEDEQKPKPKKVAVNKQEVNEQALIDAGRCPICGEPLQHSGGCDFCPNDGWSHCG